MIRETITNLIVTDSYSILCMFLKETWSFCSSYIQCLWYCYIIRHLQLLTSSPYYDHLKLLLYTRNFFLFFFLVLSPQGLCFYLLPQSKSTYKAFRYHSVQTASSWCVEICFELFQLCFGIIVWVVRTTEINRNCVYTCMLWKITLLVLADN